MNDTRRFYDQLADDYRYNFANWERSIQRQGDIITDFLKKMAAAPPRKVWDCTCGIGTQTFALAKHGYQMHGTDLSPAAIDKAKAYQPHSQSEFTIPPTFATHDLLSTDDAALGQYDVVLAFDNAIAHFHTADTLRQAVETMARHTHPGGLIVISLRDYDTEIIQKRRTTAITLHEGTPQTQAYQIWHWQDDQPLIRVQLFVTQQQDDGWVTRCHESTMRHWRRNDVTKLAIESGLTDVHWHMPDETLFYQPILSARVRT